MSRDNTTDFSSWNTKGANKDTRHWSPQSQQELQQHFSDYNALRTLEQLSQEEPAAFREIMNDQPNDPQAAVAALAKLNQSKGDELRVRAGLKKPAAKRRGGWDAGEINKTVRGLLNSGNK
jgi:hypothetical protein